MLCRLKSTDLNNCRRWRGRSAREICERTQEEGDLRRPSLRMVTSGFEESIPAQVLSCACQARTPTHTQKAHLNLCRTQHRQPRLLVVLFVRPGCRDKKSAWLPRFICPDILDECSRQISILYSASNMKYVHDNLECMQFSRCLMKFARNNKRSQEAVE